MSAVAMLTKKPTKHCTSRWAVRRKIPPSTTSGSPKPLTGSVSGPIPPSESNTAASPAPRLAPRLCAASTSSWQQRRMAARSTSLSSGGAVVARSGWYRYTSHIQTCRSGTRAGGGPARPPPAAHLTATSSFAAACPVSCRLSNRCAHCITAGADEPSICCSGAGGPVSVAVSGAGSAAMEWQLRVGDGRHVA